MLTERDRNYIEGMLGQVSYHQNGGTERHIPKTGKHRDLCMRGMGNGLGQIQGYLLAMREHGLLTEEEWMGYMNQYVYARV